MQDSLSEAISKKIDSIANRNNMYHSGKVTKINNFIVEVVGLEDAFFFEKVFVGNEENVGYVDKIEVNKVIISLVKTNGTIAVGNSVITTGEVLQGAVTQ